MGFLRMAAQVDNFRKTSGVGTGDYEADAKATVLTAMLPAFEPFEAAKEVQYAYVAYMFTVLFIYPWGCWRGCRRDNSHRLLILCTHLLFTQFL